MLNKGVTASSTGAVVDVMNTVSSLAQGVTGTVETISKALGTLNLKASAMYAKAEVDTKHDLIVHRVTSKDSAALRLATQKHAIKQELAHSTELQELFVECAALFD
ncbi:MULTISPECIES: hypothetical protein [Pantoea]|jgi:hypothetical protein|uniref:Uncharacterized protein n=1 Tax=Pantoea brenneri TaxID=472694 RepID=A0A7Y6TTM9_9GAMM|nr:MULTISPECIES: hypothetical protein [Pantoea]MBZ6397036.1 hypothetical protein [Pantoea sp.]MBZ6440213.1 hypothetical protein [Pantoea sp.]NUY43425.1 hypothetical protein [Pantoea brenneri]NUY51009.1 hypothetical protein [Pantoea brenneri]NUY61260.1 hypothetical protein [Pantoea brenneri]